MRKILAAIAAAALIAAGVTASFADWTFKDSAAVVKTMFAFTCFTTKICPASTPVNSAGTEIFTSSNPAQVTGANGTFPATVADGADVTKGAKADAACGTDNGTCSVAALVKRTNQNLTTLNTTAGTGTATNGATYPSASIGIGQKDGSGNIQPVIASPCNIVGQNSTPFSITTATTTRIIAPTASKKTYICGITLQTAGANNVGIVEGTGGTCGTGTAGVLGGTTAGSGLNLAANQGWSAWNGGHSVMQTAGTNVDFCLITSAATNLAGVVKWVPY